MHTYTYIYTSYIHLQVHRPYTSGFSQPPKPASLCDALILFYIYLYPLRRRVVLAALGYLGFSFCRVCGFVLFVRIFD